MVVERTRVTWARRYVHAGQRIYNPVFRTLCTFDADGTNSDRAYFRYRLLHLKTQNDIKKIKENVHIRYVSKTWEGRI